MCIVLTSKCYLYIYIYNKSYVRNHRTVGTDEYPKNNISCMVHT